MHGILGVLPPLSLSRRVATAALRAKGVCVACATPWGCVPGAQRSSTTIPTVTTSAATPICQLSRSTIPSLAPRKTGLSRHVPFNAHRQSLPTAASRPSCCSSRFTTTTNNNTNNNNTNNNTNNARRKFSCISSTGSPLNHRGREVGFCSGGDGGSRRGAIRAAALLPSAAGKAPAVTMTRTEGVEAAAAAPSAGPEEAVAAAPSAPAAGPQGLPKAYVRAPPGSDSLVVTLTLGGKTCNLNRPTDELLDKALTRLAKNLLAKPSKKEKRKKPGPPGGPSGAGSGADTSVDDGGVPPAVLYEDAAGTRPLDRSLPNGEAWLRAAVLEVAGARFDVEVNPPTVDKLYIDRLAMVGYPTAAAVLLSHADLACCQWRWWAQRPGAPADSWQDLGCGTQHYIPTAEDEGSVLRVECIPGAARRGSGGGGGAGGGGAAAAAAAVAEAGGSVSGELCFGEAVSGTTGPVKRGPERSSATIRCGHTPAPPTRPGFRILSYNILADQYAGSDYAQNVLFNYCPKDCLDPGYRRPLVLRELLGYHADVICLQEVDERAFTDFLTLHLGLQGYSGHYTNKQGKVREGSATFWRTSRFRRLATHDIRLREAFRRPLPPLHGQFEPLLAASRELETALQQVTTIAQATLLEPVDADPAEGCICVVNTHLFFHPYAPHIRTMHTAAILEEAAAFLERYAAGGLTDAAATGDDSSASSGGGADGSGGGVSAAAPAVAEALRRSGRRPTVLFVGDLNSDLNDGIPGVVELLRRGKLPADYWDWVQGAAFKWGMGEEDAEAMAQGTAQIAAAAAAAAAPAAADGKPEQQQPEAAAAAAAAAAGSLFAPDGHAFDSAAASPQRPIAVTGIDITLPYVLRSADDLATPYTNYTSGYKALLDYVWYEESALQVLRSVPIPSEAELGSFIPSPAFPSDHLAVVYDMEWRRPEEEKRQQEEDL